MDDINSIDDILESFNEDPNRKIHMDELVIAFFDNIELNTDAEFGSIGLDCKRPFGNSNVCQDIADIVGVELDYDNKENYEDMCYYLRQLYYDLPNYIKFKWNKLNS